MSLPSPETRNTSRIFEYIGIAVKRPESMVELRVLHPKLGSLLISIGGLATSRMVTMAFDTVRTLLFPWASNSCTAPSTCYSLVVVGLSLVYFLLCPLLPAIVIGKKVTEIPVKAHYVNLLASQSIRSPLIFLLPIMIFQLSLQFPFQGGALTTIIWAVFFTIATLDSWRIAGRFFKIRGASKVRGVVWSMLSFLTGAVVVVSIAYLLGGLSI